MAKKPAKLTDEQRDYLERRVWNYCRTPDEQNHDARYIHISVLFDAFKAGKITDLSFHLSGLPPEALETEIEIFAAHLHQSLDLFSIRPVGTPGDARSEVKAAASNTNGLMQELLDAVTDNYREV